MGAFSFGTRGEKYRIYRENEYESEVEKMTVQEVIAKVNELKSNDYSEEELTKWLTDMENDCIDNIFNRAEGLDFSHVEYDYADDEELMIPDPYSQSYVHFLCAMIDYWQQEDTYNNSMIMYNNSLQEFKNYFRRENRPKRRCRTHILLH